MVATILNVYPGIPRPSFDDGRECVASGLGGLLKKN